MPAEQTEQLRLFTAVELPADTRAGLAALQRDFPGMRWVEPSRMHLTLRFIGEVGGDAAEAVRQALAGVRAAPFVLRERLTLRRFVCIVAALAGATLVSGVTRRCSVTTSLVEKSSSSGICASIAPHA